MNQNILLLLAAGGGFILNMMNLWEDKQKPKNERIPLDWLYVVFFLFWPAVGAFLAWIYVLDGSTLRPFLALSIGLSAPTTLQSLVKNASLSRGSPAGAEE